MIEQDGFEFTFNSRACESCGGLCCLGDSGYVWITEDEIDRLAELLGISLAEVHAKYVSEAEYRYTINEIQLPNGGFACVFFDIEKECCSIYEARPEQCRTFPFWDEYVIFKDETYYACPGIRAKS